MIDITLENFQDEVLQASLQQPVLLDIWAEWCGPCKTLGPVLEKLEVAYAGGFALAKLNADLQPQIAQQLSQMFGVRSIPFCVLFKEGQPVDGFVGALPEAKVRAFLDKHVPSAEEREAQAELQEAQEAIAGGDTDAALARLQEAVALNPANETARLDLIRLLIERGELGSARDALAPIAPQAPHRQAIGAVAQWLEASERAGTARPVADLQAAIAANRRDFEARYELAQIHFAQRRWTEAMDELLEILMRDKNWQEGRARATYVAVLEIMAPPAPKKEAAAQKGVIETKGARTALDPIAELVDQYRRKLSMTLF